VSKLNYATISNLYSARLYLNNILPQGTVRFNLISKTPRNL